MTDITRIFDSSDLIGQLITIALRLGSATLIILGGRWLAGASRRRLRVVLVRTALTPSMITLAATMAYFGIWLASIMLALVFIGVPLETVLLIAVAVFVVLGIALQESLRDLAATINFILFKHFETGDIVETCGVLGRVEEIELLNTTILRADRKYAVLPNGKIQQEGLLNYSKDGLLRIDMVYSIRYEDDLNRAKQVIKDLLAEDERILADPEPLIVVLELGDNGVDIGVRPYVKSLDYWQVRWDTTEAMKLRFDLEGITIPYPQRDVHMIPPDSE